jgi:hypothetical protein
VKISEVLKVFRKLEMEITEGRDTIAKFRHKGKVIIWSRVSHGRGDLAGKIPHFIRQQLKVDEGQMKKLIDCSYWRKEYEEILRSRGFLADQESSRDRPG